MKKIIVVLLTILMLFSLFQGALKENVVKADGNYQWVSVSNGLKGGFIRSIAINPTETQTIYAGTDGSMFVGGVLKSIDSGSNWAQMNTGLTNTHVYALAIDPKNTQVVYTATTGSGVFKSTDGGSNWTQIGLTNINISSLAIDPKNSQVIYAGTSGGLLNSGIFKSTDGGANWAKMNTGDRSLYVLALAINLKDTQVVYAGTFEIGVLKSTDGGANWTDMNPGSTHPFVHSLAIDPENAQIIYAGIRGGVLKSIDGGSNWTQMNTGLPYTDIYSIAIDPKNTQIIYAGAPDSGVFKSTNGGTNWINIGLTRGVYFLVIDPKDTQIIYAASSSNVFKYIQQFTITSSAGPGGSISPSGVVTVNQGDNPSFTITSDVGYHIADVKVDGVSVFGAAILFTFNYTFINVTASHTIAATFAASTIIDSVPPAVTITSPANGAEVITASIKVEGKVTDNIGVTKLYIGSLKVDFAPDGSFIAIVELVEGTNNIKVSAFDAAGNKGEAIIAITYQKPVQTIKIVLQIGSTSFTVNGSQNTLDSPPIIKNSRTLLPIRAIVEALGGTVGWEPSFKIVTIVLGSHNLSLQIGSSKAFVDNNIVQIDSTNSKVVPEIINGRTMLPLRFITENLGCDVQWDGTTKTITITTIAEPTNQLPIASFTMNPTAGTAPLEVTLDASSSYDQDGNIVSYVWDFGVGNSGSGVTVKHTFNSKGSYNVKLTVSDNNGGVSSTIKTITIAEPVTFCQVGVPYTAIDGLTVILNSLTITEKIGSYQYNISYTLINNTSDKVIDEGTFKMYYKNESGGLPQYGFFGRLFPGDTINRTYTFEELKSKPFGILEYASDNFFSSEPLANSLKWEVHVP
jgi:PKD repeat protein/photosystem II stability/assembly factor-like uncharacterized protein